MNYIFSQGIQSTKEKINVSKILCLGLNYQNHISEMKSQKPSEPVIFMKPASAIIHNGQSIIIPEFSKNVHHEVEIVMVISKTAKNIPREQAMDYVYGFAVGLDVTLRDIQAEAKSKGHPWTVAKGFDTSAPVSEFVNKKYIRDINSIPFNLMINGELRQQGNSKDMIFKFDEIVSYLSKIFTLYRGDLIFTGTPERVGQLKTGDNIKASLDNLVTLNLDVKSALEEIISE
jgi:acylpyruvate hydrolase